MEFFTENSSDTLYSVIRGTSCALKQDSHSITDFYKLCSNYTQFSDPDTGFFSDPNFASEIINGHQDNFKSASSTDILSSFSLKSDEYSSLNFQVKNQTSVSNEYWNDFSSSPSTSDTYCIQRSLSEGFPIQTRDTKIRSFNGSVSEDLTAEIRETNMCSLKRSASEELHTETRETKTCKLFTGASSLSSSDPSSVLCTIESGSPSTNSSFHHLNEKNSNTLLSLDSSPSFAPSSSSSISQTFSSSSTQIVDTHLPSPFDFSNTSAFLSSSSLNSLNSLGIDFNLSNSQIQSENQNNDANMMLTLKQLQDFSSFLFTDPSSLSTFPTTYSSSLATSSNGNDSMFISSKTQSILNQNFIKDYRSLDSFPLIQSENDSKVFKIPSQKPLKVVKRMEAKLEIASNWTPTSSVIVLKQPVPSSTTPSLSKSTMDDISRSALALLMEASQKNKMNNPITTPNVLSSTNLNRNYFNAPLFNEM